MLNAQKQRVEWWLPGTRGRRNEKLLVNGTNLQLYKMNKYRDLMYSMVTIFNNAVENTLEIC